ncbi:MAG: EAL domain-containing protein [Pseudomonadota bacterium]
MFRRDNAPTDAAPAPFSDLNDALGVAANSEGDKTDLEVLGRVKEAIVAERIDLYLQPIVSLPQRKVRYYEAYSRLRDNEGRVLRPAVYLEAAERTGRIGVIDNLILTRCIEAVRRFGAQDPHLVVFCNVSPATLFDSEFFARFTSYLEANEDLASRLIFEFTYPSIHMMHPRVEKNLAEIAERGFAFSVDHVHSIDLDWENLRKRNFRFVKASVQMLLGAARFGAAGGVGDGQTDVMAKLREFRKRLADSGVDLIAEKIERESDMPEILAIGLDYGQGHLFGAPRRAEAYLESAAPSSE